MSLQFKIVPVTPFEQNCSVIWCDQTMQGAVVDPGGDIDKIMAVVQEHNIHLTQILLTHGHLDHAGAASPLSKQLAIPVIGPHKEDKFWLDAIEQHSSQYGFSGMYNCTPDEWLEEGQQIKVGEETLDVYHCPGHTPGHVILHHADSGLAIVGDVLFEGSIGRTDFPRGDYQTLINSITTKLWPLGNNTRFIPGHGNMSDFGRERASNPFVSDTALSR